MKKFLFYKYSGSSVRVFARLKAYRRHKKLSKKEQNRNNSVTKTLQNSYPVKNDYL